MMADENTMNKLTEYSDIYIIEEEPDIQMQETIEVIEVSDHETYTIDTNVAFPSLGESNTGLKHQLLNGREISDQHPITAITGLRDELDAIEQLQSIYSDEKQVADYFEWEDGNVLQENRIGFFVSLCDDIKKIKICDGGEIFGVVVDSAAFIGGQDDIARDARYGLVTYSGVVHVRCESDVSAGDFIVSNIYGVAKKSQNDYGCQVIALHEIDGIMYAAISLGVSINQIDSISSGLKSLDNRIDDAETNIVAAINLANEAHKRANESNGVSEEAIKNALEAMEKANNATNNIDEINKTVSSANEMAVQAKAIAESAATSAISISNAAIKVANDSLTGVNNLIENLDPISTWGKTGEEEELETWNSDGKDTSKTYYVKDTKLYYYYQNGEWVSISELNRGASYMTTYMKDGVATKAEIETAETKIEEHASAIEKSAKEFSTLVSSVDKYSVGEYSQAYGLTYEQAKSILKAGMIYIPDNNPKGATHGETYEGQGYDNDFTEHNYYEWNGEHWEEHTNAVAFFSEEPIPGNAVRYWYIDANKAPDGYEPQALYMWDEEKDEWLKVNTLAGNVNNRITSMIRQTADQIALEVTNTRGSVASLNARITETESAVQTVASWKSDVENDVSNIATIQQTANAAGASIAQVVENVGKDGKVNAASIVAAVNNDTSGITIQADHIQFDGYVSFANKKDVEDIKEKAIYDTKVEYALSSSLSNFVAVTAWSTVAPAHQSGKYMWQRTTIIKGDGTEVPSDPTCIHGADGVSISSTTVTYGVSKSASVKPTEWQSTLPTVNKGSYLWTCTVTDYSDPAIPDAVVYTYALQGEDGKTPVKGVDYKDGTSVTVKSIQYQAGTSPTTTPTGTWSNSVVSVNEGQYLWSKTTFSDGNIVYGVAKQGSSGKGVKTVTNYYLATNSSSGITTNTSGWTTTVQSVTSSNKYLWNYEEITYTNDKKETTAPCIIGAYGADGRGIKEVKEYYQVSTSNSTAPTTWVEKTPPQLTTTNKYLWNYEQITYTDNNSTTTTPCVIGVYGDTGATVKSEKKQYYLSTSQTSCTGGVWGDSPSNFKKNNYLWVRTVYTLTNDTVIYGAAVLDKTYTTISQWCKDNDETVIDGSNIATGTITAEKISTFGKCLYPDANFQNGFNEIRAYNSLVWDDVEGIFKFGAVKVERLLQSQDWDGACNNGSDYMIRILTKKFDANSSAGGYLYVGPGLGGFRFYKNKLNANSEYIYRIVAKIPIQYQINLYTECTGPGDRATCTALTSVKGTGQYQEYCFKVSTSTSNIATSNISSGFFAIRNPSIENGKYRDDTEVAWYVASATCHEMVCGTTIDGSCITTGSIKADQIDVGSLTVHGGFTSYVGDTVNTAITQTVKTVKVEYALSTSSTTAPTSGWSTTAPAWQSGKYMWQKTTISYTGSDKPDTVTTTCIQGAAGTNGTNGTSVTGVETRYHLSNSNTSAPANTSTSWNTNFDTILTAYISKKKTEPDTTYYIWSQEKVTYSSGNPTYSTPTVNSAEAKIANWCDENDQTKIHGSHIATGTITANQISTGTLKSNEYSNTETGVIGTCFDLDKGTIISKNFSIDKDGNASINGSLSGGAGAKTGEYDSTFQATLSATNKKITNFGVVTAWYNHAYKLPTLTEATTLNFTGINSNDEYFILGAIPKSEGTLSHQGHTTGRSCTLTVPAGTWYFIHNTKSSSKAKGVPTLGDKSFRLDKDGSLYASNAYIGGHIEATSGSFTGTLRAGSILGDGAWKMAEHWLYAKKLTGVTVKEPTDFDVCIGAGGILIPNGATYKQVSWDDITGSDRAFKDNITQFSEQYDTFFNNLKPCSFNYNTVFPNGDPNRVHFGFIAQDVITAQNDAQLENLALIGIHSTEHYGLYLKEFIALNTWQIQKAKARITELEEKVAALEQKLSNLT